MFMLIGGLVPGILLTIAVKASGAFAFVVSVTVWALCVWVPFRLHSQIQRRRQAAEAARRNSEPCPHGVPGGKTMERCPDCQGAEVEARRREEEEWRLARLRREARELKEREKGRLRKEITLTIRDLRQLTPQGFENAVAEMYRRLGFEVQQTPFSADKGVDVWVAKGNKKCGVQCKRYGSRRAVGRPELQMLVGAVSGHASHAAFVTTGRFTKAAYDYAAEQRDVELIGPARLAGMVAEAWPEARADLSVNTMCRKCGEVLPLPLRVKGCTEGRCGNGHTVVNGLTIVKLLDFAPHVPRRRKSVRFPRRRRRLYR